MTDRLTFETDAAELDVREYALETGSVYWDRVPLLARGRDGAAKAMAELTRKYLAKDSMVWSGSHGSRPDYIKFYIGTVQSDVAYAQRCNKPVSTIHRLQGQIADLNQERDMLLALTEFLDTHQTITADTPVDDPRLDHVFVPSDDPTSEDVDRNALNLFYGVLSENIVQYTFTINTLSIIE